MLKTKILLYILNKKYLILRKYTFYTFIKIVYFFRTSEKKCLNKVQTGMNPLLSFDQQKATANFVTKRFETSAVIIYK